MRPSDLSRFFVDVLDDPEPRRAVLSRLYYEATAQGKYLRRLFPHIADTEIEVLDSCKHNNDRWGESNTGERPFYLAAFRTSDKYTHAAGKACSRPLNEGEPVRRCQQCGYDSSCVLCVKCFNPDDHIGHNITTYIATELNNGICDCGDPEAFKPLNCICAASETELLQLPDDLRASLEHVVDVCLNVILDVLEFSILTVPCVNKAVRDGDSITGNPVTLKTLAQDARFSPDAYGKQEKEITQEWHLILWNDEFHDYPSAREAIISAIGVSPREANDLAEKINDDGFAVLDTAPSCGELLDSCRKALKDGLTATIISGRDLIRQSLVDAILWWFKDITLMDHDLQTSNLASSILARKLLEPGHKLNSSFTTSKLFTFLDGRGLLNDGMIINESRIKLNTPDAVPESLLERIGSSVRTDDTFSHHLSPLQFFLLYHNRMNKILRALLTELLLSVLVKDPDTKVLFSEHFMQIYPNLLWAFSLSEREEELSVVLHIPPQLFTCPRTVRSIIERKELPLLLIPLAEVIEASECDWFDGEIEYFRGTRSASFYSLLRCSRLALGQGLSNLCTIFAQARLYLEVDSSWFPHFLFVMRPFQHFFAKMRKYGDHVGYDDSDYLAHMSQATPVCELAAIVGQLPADDKQGNIEVLRYLIEYTCQDNHMVTQDPTAFIHPYHVLLSFMIRSDCLPEISSDQIKLIVSDPLGSIVLANQVKSHLWVRNGPSIMRQALQYLSPYMNHVTYYRDLFLCQVAAAYEDSEEILTTYLDRWELSPWLRGAESVDNTVYKEHFLIMVENFLVFLYIVITDRALLTYNDEEHKHVAARMAAIYALCEGPQPYSHLFRVLKLLDSKVDMDGILDEIADFQAPSALDDSGMYRLKPGVLENIDPITRYLDYSLVQPVLDTMTQAIAKSTNTDVKKAVVKPRISHTSATRLSDSLGGIAKLHKFAKLAFKLLQHSIDSLDHTYVYVLLHLLHAAISEDEEKYGPKYLNASFVQVPLGSLLFVIAQLPFPATIVSKAEFLLDSFLDKSFTFGEELVAAFGKDAVENYRERNHAKSASLDDERKAMAEKRRLKVLKKFAKQRDAFILQNEGPEDLKEENPTLPQLDNLRVCVFCGGKESFDSLIGVLARKGEAPALWTLKKFTDASFFASFGENNISNAEPFTPSVGVPSSIERGSRMLYSTCGHCAHLECFIRARRAKPGLECPLCRSIQDVLVPSFIFRDAPIETSKMPVISSSEKCKSMKELVTSIGRENPENLINLLLLPEYGDTAVSDWAKDLRIIMKCDQGYGKEEFEETVSMTEEISTTIQTLEVATRVEGDAAYSDFLSLVPGSAYTLVRSLVQTRAVRTHYAFPGNYHRFSKKILMSHWDGFRPHLKLSPFSVMKNLFLQCDGSFSSFAAYCFEMAITQLIDQRKLAFDATDKFYLTENNIDPAALEAINTIGRCLKMRSMNASQLRTIYLIWEKMALTFLRQAALFLDILTSTCVGENTFVRSIQFEDLSSKIQQQPYLACTKSLTSALGLRSFDDHLVDMAFKIKLSGKFKCPKNNFVPQYPGAPRLVNLPDDHFACATYVSQHSPCDNGDLVVCLHCGGVLESDLESLSHLKTCSSGSGIFYSPRRNEFTVVVRLFNRTLHIQLPGPYLTKHGEVRKWNSSENATLSHFRYETINKLWITQGLNAQASRVFLALDRRGQRFRELPEEPMIYNDLYTELLQNRLVDFSEIANFGPSMSEDEEDDDDDDDASLWLD